MPTYIPSWHVGVATDWLEHIPFWWIVGIKEREYVRKYKQDSFGSGIQTPVEKTGPKILALMNHGDSKIHQKQLDFLAALTQTPGNFFVTEINPVERADSSSYTTYVPESLSCTKSRPFPVGIVLPTSFLVRIESIKRLRRV
jgi:hypothetical protein